VLILALVPDNHQSVSFVFGHTINNSGFGHSMFWWYVLPLGFLLTMYTQTGYDASAHISEETHGAAKAAAQGVWRSVFWSGVGGWIVLLAITFAATDIAGINKGFGSSLAVFSTALPAGWDKMVVVIATIGQLFCGMACVTSCSRMTYAFSRDHAIPGWRLWTRLNHHRVPAYAVIFACVCALVMTLPALWGDQNGVAYAFLAVVSICVIGLYIAYVIPVYLRWRMGDAFQPGPWTLGRKYRWINPAAIVWVAICVVIFILPFSPAAVPGRKEFDWRYVNYAPATVGGLLLIVGVWWLVRARHTFRGPVRNVEFDEGAGVT
jgi:amino acid transporter